MCYIRWGNEGGPKIEIVKKLILVILPWSIFLWFGLASYGTVNNGRGVYKLKAIGIITKILMEPAAGGWIGKGKYQ